MIHSSNLPLFSDLSSFNLIPKTKSDMMEDDTLLSLESLLDRSREEVDRHEIYRITAIPFKEGYCSGCVSVTSEAHSSISADSLSRTGIFLVRTYDTELNTIDYMVVTMIPDVECQERMGVRELSYIDKSEFSGLLLYSSLDGTFLESLYVRYATPLAFGTPVSSTGTIDSDSCDGSIYLSTGRTEADTKALPRVTVDEAIRIAYSLIEHAPSGRYEIYSSSNSGGSGGGGGSGSGSSGGSGGGGSSGGGGGSSGGSGGSYGGGKSSSSGSDSDLVNGGVLDTAYCVADKKENKQKKKEEKEEEITRPTGGGGGGGGGGGTPKPDSTRNKNLSKDPREKYRYFVSLSTNGKGSVLGGGVYMDGTTALISTTPDKGCYFYRWSGDLASKGPNCVIKVKSNITSCALFMDKMTALPCYDAKTGLINVLRDMQLAPTGSGNKDNARYYCNVQSYSMGYCINRYTSRDAGLHQGIDLAAEEGTPIYAPCDGYISSTQAFVTGQPDRIVEGKDQGKFVDPNYKGDKDNAGNRFTLECEVNGKKVGFTFWHLQAGNAVAVNPRSTTGEKFKRGDKVYQGEIIGYVGRTGNAYNVPTKHLHLGVKDLSTGKWLNPEKYINGMVDAYDGKVNDAAIININCDSTITDYFTL